MAIFGNKQPNTPEEQVQIMTRLLMGEPVHYWKNETATELFTGKLPSFDLYRYETKSMSQKPAFSVRSFYAQVNKNGSSDHDPLLYVKESNILNNPFAFSVHVIRDACSGEVLRVILGRDKSSKVEFGPDGSALHTWLQLATNQTLTQKFDDRLFRLDGPNGADALRDAMNASPEQLAKTASDARPTPPCKTAHQATQALRLRLSREGLRFRSMKYDGSGFRANCTDWGWAVTSKKVAIFTTDRAVIRSQFPVSINIHKSLSGLYTFDDINRIATNNRTREYFYLTTRLGDKVSFVVDFLNMR